MSRVKDRCDKILHKLGEPAVSKLGTEEGLFTDTEALAYTLDMVVLRLDRLGERVEAVEEENRNLRDQTLG